MARVSKNIKKIRKEQNITQDALAERLGVTRQAISNWENDKSQPDIESLKLMAEFFGVEIEELIYGEKRNVGVESDKTKEKTALRIVLSSIGSIFAAVGLVMIFANFWEDFPMGAKAAFSFAPILLGQAAALYVYLKRFDSIVWRESASALWMVGVVSTVALVSGVLQIELGVVNCLLIDILLCMPIAYIFNSVTPIAPLCGMAIAWRMMYLQSFPLTRMNFEATLYIMILFLAAAGFSAFFNRNRLDNFRLKYSLWVLVIAAVVAVVYGFSLPDCLWLLPALFAAFYSFADTDSSLTLPLKPIGLLGSFIMMLVLAAVGDDYISFYDGVKVSGMVSIAIITLIFAASAVGGFVFDLKKYKFNIYKMIIMCCALISMVIETAIAFAEIVSCSKGSYHSFVNDFDALKYVFIVLAAIIAVTLIVKGARELKLLSMNVGLVAAFAVMIEFLGLMEAEMLLTGFLLLIFGAVLIGVNIRIAGIKRKSKAVSETTEAEQ